MNAQARAFSLTSATLNLSASPNVTPGLLRLAQVPLGPALTFQSAPIPDALFELWTKILTGEAFHKPEVLIKPLSELLNDDNWHIREYATTFLKRLGEADPNLGWKMIAPLLESNEPEVCGRAREVYCYLYIEPLRAEVVRLRRQYDRIMMQKGYLDMETLDDLHEAEEDLEAAETDCRGKGLKERKERFEKRRQRYTERERKLKESD